MMKCTDQLKIENNSTVILNKLGKKKITKNICALKYQEVTIIICACARERVLGE